MPSSRKQSSKTPQKFASIDPQSKTEFKVQEIKKPCNAYVFFCKERSAQIKLANPAMKQCDVMTETSKFWKPLEDKSAFEALALSDMARYREQLKSVETQGFFLNSSGEKCRPGPKKQKSNLAHTPEKNQPVFKYKLTSPLSLDEIRKNYPDLEVQRATSETRPYSIFNNIQMKCENKSAKKTVSKKVEPATMSQVSTLKRSKSQKVEGPKRPKSAYLFFCADKQKDIMKKQGFKLTEAAKACGQLWRELKNKKKYENLALNDVKRYQAEMAEQQPAVGAKRSAPTQNYVSSKPTKKQKKN